MSEPKGYKAPSVTRALKILELVAQADRGLGISQLARRLGLSKGTVFGICGQLEEGGALVRDSASKHYGLGPLVVTLAGRGMAYARLKEAAGPELTRLCEQFNESVFLGVATLRGVTVVDTRQPAGAIGISAGPGTRLPLTAGAVGKVFLAGMAPAVVDSVLARGLPAYTPRSITDPEAFRRQLEEVRARGWAKEQDEYLLGVWGVAVALGSQTGLPAAMWMVGFASTLGEGPLAKMQQALSQTQRRVNRILRED